jgi:Flp pilus assembly protein TadG
MTASALRAIESLWRRRDGLAAVEFAFIAPIMIVLFFGVIEGSAAYSTSRKVTLAANALADLVAQETEVTKDALDDLLIGMTDIVDAADADIAFRVVSLVRDAATGDVEVHWSRDSDGGVPYAAGSVYPGGVDPDLFDDAASLIVAEADYAYASPLSQKLIGPITMKAQAIRWPRLSNRVQFCIVAGSCTS